MKSISPAITFIGVDDDNLDLFEAQYPLATGISYNSYLIADEKTAIVDAVDARRTDEWLALLSAALGQRNPEYLIVQHMEPDHSGSIRALMAAYPDIKIVATKKAIDMLGDFFEDLDFSDRTIPVTDNDTLQLGRTKLSFLTAPMVHWPEVMFTFDETDGVLFTADAFGSFAVSTATDAWPSEARRYYANIVGKYGVSVQTVLKKMAGKDIKVIAPLHGPVLTGHLDRYIALYDKWSRYEAEDKGTLVAYVSIYGGTAEAARMLAVRLRENSGEDVVMIDLSRRDISYGVAEAFRLDKLVLCSVTYDGGLFPAMHNFIHHLSVKGLRNRRVGLIQNGSWAPVAARIMTEMLSKMKDMTIVEPVVTLHSRMHNDNIPVLTDLAESIGKA
ncbi:MAG: MBL fold metallo-hydrolase [Bacteroides sp.]|nr:MBL fold metallo-hydrolase [Bacteroides sp.]